MGYNFPPDDEKFKLYSVIETIIESIQDGNGKPFFHKGFWKELASNLSEIRSAKFPLVYLPILYSEKKEDNRVFDTVSFDLYIITESLQKYSTDYRITNIIDGILEPIYDDLITAIMDNSWFNNVERYLPHTKELIPYLGAETEDQNKLNRVVDAIYLSFKDIKIIKLKDY